MFRQAVRFAAIALLLAACSTSSASPSSSGLGSFKPGPNAGRVLFGDSYDKTTFVISGPTTQVPQGTDRAFVAHFASRVTTGAIHLLGVLNGHTILDHAVPVTNGPWSVYAMKIPGAALSQPGALLVRVVDDGNVLLATGTLNVTPGPSGSPGSSRSPASPDATGVGGPDPS
jgi:hypothetical protein